MENGRLFNMDRFERLSIALQEYADVLKLTPNTQHYIRSVDLARNKIVCIFEECIPERLNGECWNDCIDEMMHELDNLRAEL
jgi:hypothetical protein